MIPNRTINDTLAFMEQVAQSDPDTTPVGLTVDGRLVRCQSFTEGNCERLTQKLQLEGLLYNPRQGLRRNIAIIRQNLQNQAGASSSARLLPDGVNKAVKTLCNQALTFARSNCLLITPQAVTNALKHLALGPQTLDMLQAFFARLSNQPNSQTNSHYQNCLFFQRVCQLLSYLINDANHETATALIHLADTITNADCHDQTAATLDRILQTIPFHSLRAQLVPDSNHQINWFNFLHSVYKQFHDRAFEEALEQTSYDTGNVGSDKRLQPLISHHEFIGARAMLKNLFTLDRERKTGVCDFGNNALALNRPHWLGSLSSFKQVLSDVYGKFYSTITTEEAFIRFFEELFQEHNDEEESLWSLTIKAHPQLKWEIDEINRNAQELSCSTARDDAGQIALMEDLANDRKQAIANTKRGFITLLLAEFRERLFAESPVLPIAEQTLHFNSRVSHFRPVAGPGFDSNVVNVWQTPPSRPDNTG